MKVYTLEEFPDHEAGWIIGVFESVEKAEEALLKHIERLSPFYKHGWVKEKECHFMAEVQYRNQSAMNLQIREFELNDLTIEDDEYE